MATKTLKPGDLITCVLCGGDTYVSEETAREHYGRRTGNTRAMT